MSPTGRYVDHNESTSVYPVLVSRNHVDRKPDAWTGNVLTRKSACASLRPAVPGETHARALCSSPSIPGDDQLDWSVVSGDASSRQQMRMASGQVRFVQMFKCSKATSNSPSLATARPQPGRRRRPCHMDPDFWPRSVKPRHRAVSRASKISGTKRP